MLAVTPAMLLFKELGKLVDVTDAVFPGTDTNLSCIVPINETLLRKLNKVYAIVLPKGLIITGNKCFYSITIYFTMLLDVVHYLAVDAVHQLFQISISLFIVRAVR